MILSTLFLALASSSATPTAQLHASGQSVMVVEHRATHQISYRRLPGTDDFVQEIMVPVDLAPKHDIPDTPPALTTPSRHDQTLIGCW